jgi:hypothetical protein
MANLAHLTGCPGRGAAQRYDFKAIWEAPGLELNARYSVPLFWLAGFDRTDEVLTHWPPPGAARAAGFSDEMMLALEPIALQAGTAGLPN